MKLTYMFDSQRFNIQETEDGGDVRFRIQGLEEVDLHVIMQRIQQDFEENRVITDVLMYVYPHQTFEFIVRQDFYVDFILSLMKYQILQRITWI
ncbi:hypothetical protein [Paenibacillus selenitireducens]|uniref:hypothetical protein n=1 Tax=Paenibacillus selenitireducens TaxID=1324314 RepID=UPI00099856DF|nr:hypothetical protein [Paenibacillus selenitireducens]